MGSLNNAIEAAAAELKQKAAAQPQAGAEEAAEEVQTEEITEESTEEETSEETPEADDLSETELVESKNLYKALKNPQTAAAVVAALAQQAGLLPKAGDAPLTKREEAAAKRETIDIVKDALGPEYSFLADKLGKIFDEVVQQTEKKSEERFAEIQQSNVEREVVASYEALAKETKGESKKFETRMAQLSEEIPIGNMNVKTYMQRLYTLASNERKSSPQKVADQIRRNASDAPARLRSTAVPLNETDGPGDKKRSLDESIAWAVSQQAKGKK